MPLSSEITPVENLEQNSGFRLAAKTIFLDQAVMFRSLMPRDAAVFCRLPPYFAIT
jgi:hypothetical protein